MTRLFPLVVGFLLSVGGILSAAQSTLAPSTSSLLANAVDLNGMAIRDLTKDSFQVKVNGRTATLLDASSSIAPRRIVVLFDMSGSMAGARDNSKWRIAREALQEILTETPSGVSIALLPFSDQVHDVFDFSQSRKSMMTWLNEGASQHDDKRVRERTALIDAVQAATRIFGSVHSGDAIYAITDGRDNSSHAPVTSVRKILLESGIRLFVFFFADQPRNYEMVDTTESFKEVSRATGGFVFSLSGNAAAMGFESFYDYSDRTRQTLKVYTRALNSQVNGFYTLRFESPVAAEKVRKVSVEIVDSKAKPRKDVVSTYSTIPLPQSK